MQMRVIAALEFRVFSELPVSTQGGHFRFLLPIPCPPALTLRGERLPDGLLGGSCGRRKRRSMSNGENVGPPACFKFETLFSERVSIVHMSKKYVV